MRGFKDLQANDLATFSATASRHGQRVVNAAAAQYGYELWSADVGQAFLRGLTFAEISRLTGEPLRQVQFDLPAGSVPLLRQLPGMGDFDPSRECLDMVRPGFGLKDAPRAWSIRLDQELTKHGLTRTQADRCLYVMFENSKLVLIISTHVDDLKGAGTKKATERILEILTRAFGKLKVCRGSFEHTGVQHEQDPKTYEVSTTQDHYVKQLRPMALDSLNQVPDEQLVEESMHPAFWSLLGGASWVLVTRADVAVYVGHLQRNAKKPNAGHLRLLNKIVKWMKRRPCSLVYKHVPPPLRLLVLSDSAYRAAEPDCLALRAAILAIVTDGHKLGGPLHVLDFYSRKQTLVSRSTFSAELLGLADAASSGLHLQSLLEEVFFGARSADALVQAQTAGTMQVPLDVAVDAMAVWQAVTAEELKPPTERHMFLHVKAFRDKLDAGSIRTLWWVDTRDMLCDCLTKGGISREAVLEAWRSAQWALVGDAPRPWRAKRGSG